MACAAEVMPLPVDRPRPAVATQRGASVNVMLPMETLAGLRALGRAEGATTFMTVLALSQAMLARYTGQEDVVIGTPTAGRERSQLQGLVGFFVNMLALRVDPPGALVFWERARSRW